MNKAVTYIAPIKLAAGVTEDQLFAASARFQTEFVAHEPGVLRRELIKKADGVFADIVLFRSVEDAQQVIEKEQSSEACGAFFSLMDTSSDAEIDPAELGPFPSIAVYE